VGPQLYTEEVLVFWDSPCTWVNLEVSMAFTPVPSLLLETSFSKFPAQMTPAIHCKPPFVQHYLWVHIEDLLQGP
jgi:hypothetical protein